MRITLLFLLSACVFGSCAVGGKTYRCQKIAGTQHVSKGDGSKGDGNFELLLSDDIPGKGYSFKVSGTFGGTKGLEETRLKKIEAHPPAK